MKHLLLSAMAAMAVAFAPSATAQNAAIDAAIERLKESKTVTSNTTSSTISDTDNKPVYYSKQNFTVPKRNKDLVMQLEKAFKAGEKKAYYSVFQNKEDDNYRRIYISLPSGGSLTAGRDDDYYSRVLCYKDPADDNYRYSYVLEWTDEDVDDEGYTGFVAKVYGKKPSQNQRELSISLPSVGSDGNFSVNKGKVYISKGNKKVIVDNSGNATIIKGNDTITVPASVSGLNLENLQFGNDDGEEIADNQISSATDILQKFGFYRQKIIEYANGGDNATTLNIYTNQIYKLCKDAVANNLLNAAERSLCAKELRNVAPKVKDSFDSSLLLQAAQFLEGTGK